MQASKLIENIKFKRIVPELFEDFRVSLLTQDTREVIAGSIFVAIKGTRIDGHKLVQEAKKNGAAMIIAQEPLPDMTIPVVYVQNTNRAMAILSSFFYGASSQALRVIGVTGTNGKTTVTHIIEAIFSSLNENTGLIGTMYRKIGDEVLKTKNTTPDIITLQRTLNKMVEKGVSTVAMEVSSIALVQGRVWGIDFDVAVFTNLTEDHLDYHKTMAEYAHAKSLLFSQLGNKYAHSGDHKVAVLNNDDSLSKQLEEDTAAEVITYGIKNNAMIRATNVEIHGQGTNFDLTVFNKKYSVTVKMVGMFNVYNILAAFAAAYACGVSPEKIIKALEQFSGVKGRLQLLTSQNKVSAIVDYSHTPDGLLNALETINEFAKGKVFCIIGCGGDRDRFKRPKMGKIAVENSDFAIFTSDNPRSENPQVIIDEMLAGIPELKEIPTFIDRREAINFAVSMAQPGDIILVAGKGHEDYQIIGATKYHFDDAEEVKKAFELKEQMD
ncbi:UDP-N-acetylmuramoyl-L-alanyl-D-glutamate--2,6-diaminopimelate ligase [Liquorilactobacillus cacaonum]|uniref:UDP-N-acetylmuramoyl-L-alanyl-D-glutamate--2,6-diaminopimelate ligase n=1 Tax=Liquorilactobacillus cacaonum DSM 21116 TaxID=1423729 RepID=A0A0R2CSV7_9LACO|nr:UDP-N-acetylmuramoyl-L-alanyl-D-glutamate--2,6-diaminopimelate ligase [Liquorilactobacillus cacaonum]KRM90723.1 UDP-N-acetylmuramoylalanyl-D-glutamate--2,6-diaminopimelate ligase [Liquorilactobacillus cacaonum DSM 21116]